MIPFNSDIYVDVILQEDDLPDGTPGPRIDYGLLAGLMILVYQDIKNPIAEYQKNVPAPNPTGILAIGETNAVQGEIFILIPRAKNKNLTAADIYLQVFEYIEDVNGQDGLFRATSDPIKLDKLSETVGRNKNILTI